MKTRLSIITAIFLLGTTMIIADDYETDGSGISEEMQEQMAENRAADEALAAEEEQAVLQNREDRNDEVFQESASSHIVTNGLEGLWNTYYGDNAGNGDNHGQYNSAFGYSAGDKITGSSNAFFGDNSGAANTSGNRNSFLGALSGYNNISGNDNVFAGNESGYNNKTASANVYIGSHSGYRNDTANGRNTFVGHYSGYQNLGAYNNFFGYWAAHDNTSGSNNLMMGAYAGRFNTTGSKNVFLGDQSGYNNKTGSGNVFIGPDAGYNETGSSKLYIDNRATPNPIKQASSIVKEIFRCSICLNTCELPAACCPVCLNVIGCIPCLEQWIEHQMQLSPTCPLCRANENYQKIPYITKLAKLIGKERQDQVQKADTGGSQGTISKNSTNLDQQNFLPITTFQDDDDDDDDDESLPPAFS